jgi:tetratricopeptide (TPR) repeat protein
VSAEEADGAGDLEPLPEMQERRRLQAFLHGLPVSVLAEKLMQMADSDFQIERELQCWRRASEVTCDPTELEAIADGMLEPGRHYIKLGEGREYVRRGEAVLPLLRQTCARDAQVAVRLGGHALRRAWELMNQADDSGDEFGELCRAIGAEWVACVHAAGPQPGAFGETYLQLLLEDPIESFDPAAAETAMGEAARQGLRQALQRRWRAARDALRAEQVRWEEARARRKGRYTGLPPRPDSNLWQLERMHLERSGDIEGALAVLRDDLATPQRHAAVVGFLVQHGRHREALLQAEEGCRAFPDDPGLHEALLRCLEGEGRLDEALVLRRKQFERRPGVEAFHALLEAAKAAGHDVAALRESVLAWLQSYETAGGPYGPNDVTLRAQILCSENRWSEAARLVQPPASCSLVTLRAIALRLDAEERDTAAALLMRVLDAAMDRATSPYRMELQLVAETAQRMHAPQRAVWLAHLRKVYAGKRNFLNGLPVG